ncbi:MAG: hypothetical protein BEN18_03100 [Epulopiscium sp. Nuni2H_MBin001]|nr:MAG: hypothetical protein BEN18_03100 [Epulopiscium sp. Nuni2H_MBin001]
MLTRIITGIIGIPIALWILASGGMVMQGFGVVLALIAMYEYFKAVERTYKPMKEVGMLSVGVFILGYQTCAANFQLYLAIIIVVMLSINVFYYPVYKISDIAITLFGILYVGLLLGLIIPIRELDNGLFWVVLVFICAWGSDTCAYFAGKFFGKRKLAPELSPKKTVVGAVGGIVGAGILSFLFAQGVMYYWSMDFSINWLIIITLVGCIGAMLSQIGDLAASSIKRSMDVKDFGSLFPGHGGVLDRFDSVILVTPLIYLVSHFYNYGMDFWWHYVNSL